MTRMVACIEATGGVVDKFIGDAIMGVWGAPLSAGTPKDDALAAIRAMIMMRESLLEFNRDRGGPDKPLIHNGSGLNTGPCIAGQIGSMSRMEYTVIGDAVNLASRIEALNKPFGTDVLISEYTYELVKDDVVAEPMPSITVKGKVGRRSRFTRSSKVKETPKVRTRSQNSGRSSASRRPRPQSTSTRKK